MADIETDQEILKDVKPREISIDMVIRRHFDVGANRQCEEEVVKKLHKITHVRLDRECIGNLDNLLLFSANVTNIYLQHNLIEKIEGLEFLVNLRFLTLAFNRIKTVTGISDLRLLSFLDLSYNNIAQFDPAELPESLASLSFEANPCTSKPDYRSRLVERLPRLQMLDGVEVENVEQDGDSDSNEELQTNKKDKVNKQKVAEADAVADGRSMGDLTNSILMRSQSYLEERFVEHKKRLEQLSDIRTAPQTPLH